MNKKILRVEFVEKNKFFKKEDIENDILFPEYVLEGNVIFLYETEEERNKLIEKLKGLEVDMVEQGDLVYLFGMKEITQKRIEKIKEFLINLKESTAPKLQSFSNANKEESAEQKDGLKQEMENIVNNLMDKFKENKDN